MKNALEVALALALVLVLGHGENGRYSALGAAIARHRSPTVNLEFFEDGSWEGGPLLLLYGGPLAEVPLLQEVFRSLAAELGRRVSIDTLPFIRVINSCTLTAVSENADRGVVTLGPSRFEWRLSPPAWKQADWLLQPFNDVGEPVGHFQFLNPAEGAEVIYSRGRSW